MPLDRAHYHGWHGKLRSPWRGTLAIVRVSLMQVLRRKAYWFVIAMGLLLFLIYFALIYIATQLDTALAANPNLAIPGEEQQTVDPRPDQPPPPTLRERLLEGLDFGPQPDEDKDNGYLRFMEQQSHVVMILVAFSGSLVVGSDFRLKSLPFYLSRRVYRRHYIAGKLLGVSAVICLLTVLPALALFAEYGMFTSSIEYWSEYSWIVFSILGYGLVLCVVLSTVVVTLSAYLKKMAPIAITCFSLFILLGIISRQLRDATDDQHWALVDLWRNMRYAGRYCFDQFSRSEDRELGFWSLWILSALCVVCLGALFHKVRAVEIVE
jgi:hypothetical protein